MNVKTAYYPHTAQKKYKLRRSYCHRGMFHNQEILDYIDARLRETCSPEQMAKCDIYVMPSRYETFGVVYAEAMACGKPVIGTKTGGPDGFVTEESRILVDIENIEQLTQAMVYMIDNYDKYNAENIRKIVIDNFSMNAIATKLEEIYKDIIKC